ncbi:MAG: UDP-4-amino-4,6-dideoxy-N-acetyl-beta-L-altrosamine N-acetyltransferase, partial [Acidobacteria bacterium]|nr:UDP-4-amino-4,6-dideoxy-N-acetyl-beta-L-altrosamine N-acetyltransferase [Acidobacteriota bacterium]
MVIQARNQIKQAEDLARIGAAVIYDPSEDHAGRDLASLVERISQTENYTDMSQAAAAVTRGEGLPQIAECIVSGDRERLEIDQLVPMTEVHLEQVLAWRNDPRVRQNMYSQHEISLEEHNDWWRAAKDRSDRRYYIFQTNGVDAGFVSITDIDRKNGTASWAFFSANTAPKGTGTRMERAALKMAFEELGLRKLCCEVLGFNSRVVAFHKRFGFRIEGTLAAHKLINGGYCDVILMAAF